jgi:two-component system, NarL family, nitrate/nitrite sensor histidine kinase NarX
MSVDTEHSAAGSGPSLFNFPGALSRRLLLFALVFLLCSAAIAALGLYLWRNADASGFAYAALLVLLVVTAAVVYLAMDCVKTCLYQPLERIMNWAAEIRQGNLSARIPESAADELVGPVDDINRAAEWLEALALDKERELENQKFDLERKSRSLQLLYDVATGINNATEVEQLTSRFMYTLADAVGARAASVRLREADGAVRVVGDLNLEGELLRIDQIAGTNPALFTIGADLDMTDLVAQLRESGDDLPADEIAGLRLMVIRLTYLEQVKGVYLMFIERGRLDDSAELRELLDSIGRQLGLAVEKARLDYEANLLPRMQERAMLANELHDSLAQTLASLRFQVRVLDDTLHQGDESATWAEMERLEASLEEANVELRELIRHFRAPIHRRGLIPAISQVVTRFRKESRINTFFQNQWDDIDVPSEWDVHVVRIVQEALANIRKHSRADNVRVLLSHDAGGYRVLIEDDGEGFSDASDGKSLDDHFGLSIMQERAEVIGGELKVESEPGEGTRVVLCFARVSADTDGWGQVVER